MSTNYSEQIFQAVDTIVSQRLNEVSFDKTEICEVVSQNKDFPNRYLVSNGALKFEARSDDTNREYSDGSKVYVRITNGDYNLEKVITGAYTADEIPKNLYTNPFDHLIASSEISIPTSELKVAAKKDGTETIKSVTKTGLTFHYSGLGQFNYIGLDFSATTGFGGTIGEFQIVIDLLNSSGTSLLTNEQKGLLTFSSRQLYGNPYYLTSALHFQHLFNFPLEYNNVKFSDLTKVKQIKVTLRSLGNFNYPNTATTTDININSLKLYFGFDSTEDSMSENTVALVLDNPVNGLEYSTATDEKEMSIDWRNLTTNAIYNETDNKQYPTAGEYWVYWLQYSESIGYTKKLEKDGGIDIDESGTYWKTVQKKDANTAAAYTYTLSPCADWKKEQIKVIIKHKNGDYIESKGLTFTNKNFRSETGSNQGSKDTLRLSLAEGDDGVYNSYGIDNKLLTSYNLEHSLTVDYVDNTNWNKDLQKVIWKIPKNATMIKQPEGWSTQGNFYVLEVNYDTSLTDGGKTIKFKLSDQFSYNKTNNTIYCEIIRYKDKNRDIISDEYQGSITLQFGLQHTAGTGWAFNIVQNQRALSYPSDTMTLTATFENEKGEPISLDSWKDKVKWEWYQSSNNSYTLKQKSDNKHQAIIERPNGSYDPYAIVKATLVGWQNSNGKNVDLEAYLPIAAGHPSYYLTGASRVVYNNTGNAPIYDEEAYGLYNQETHNLVSPDYTYTIMSPETNPNKVFAINEEEGDLKPLNLLPTQVPKMSLVVKEPSGTIVYAQPILVLKNGYQSKLLNEWDGNLKVDTENNSIFSALMGAGIKNDDNTFTGVLMGAVGKTLSTAKTGIYGMQNGELRFAFDERGAAYVGTGDDNKIAFNGLGGTGSEELEINAKKFNLFVAEDSSYNLLSSKPSDWNNNYTKFYVKKDNKYILNTNSTWKNNTYYKLVPELYIGNSGININNKSAWLSFKDKIHFYKDGTATIGGWTIGTSSLSCANTDTKKQDYTRWLYFGTTNSAKLMWTDNKEKSVALRLGNGFGVTTDGKLYASGADIQGNITAKTLKLDKSIQIGEDNLVLTNTEAAINTNRVNIAAHKTTIDSHTTTINSHTTTINSHTTLINGKVSFSDLSTSGKTTINGGNITTGTLNANLISGTNSNTVTFDGNVTIKGNATFLGTIKGTTILQDGVKFGTNGYSSIYTDQLGTVWTYGDKMDKLVNSYILLDKQNITLQSACNNTSTTPASITLNKDVLTLSGTNITAGSSYAKFHNIYLEYRWDSKSSSYKNWVAFGGRPTADPPPPRIKGQGGNLYLHALKTNTFTGAIYAGGEDSNDKIATQGGSPSTLNLKTSLVNIKTDYNNLYQELQQINMYNYDYQYDNLNNENIAKYGFIIDEIENTQYLSQYFKHYDKYGKIIDNNLIVATQNDYDIQYKIWDRDSYIKGQFILIKTLQNKIDQLEKEIKEIKQNEI